MWAQFFGWLVVRLIRGIDSKCKIYRFCSSMIWKQNKRFEHERVNMSSIRGDRWTYGTDLAGASSLGQPKPLNTAEQRGSVKHSLGKCVDRILGKESWFCRRWRPFQQSAAKAKAYGTLLTRRKKLGIANGKKLSTQGHIFHPSWRQHQSWESQHLRQEKFLCHT